MDIWHLALYSLNCRNANNSKQSSAWNQNHSMFLGASIIMQSCWCTKYIIQTSLYSEYFTSMNPAFNLYASADNVCFSQKRANILIADNYNVVASHLSENSNPPFTSSSQRPCDQSHDASVTHTVDRPVIQTLISQDFHRGHPLDTGPQALEMWCRG